MQKSTNRMTKNVHKLLPKPDPRPSADLIGISLPLATRKLEKTNMMLYRTGRNQFLRRSKIESPLFQQEERC